MPQIRRCRYRVAAARRSTIWRAFCLPMLVLGVASTGSAQTSDSGGATSELAAPSIAQAPPDAEADPVRPNIQRVALFKNGLGYFQSAVRLPDAHTVSLGGLPAPTHGTFWVGYDRNVPLNAVVASMGEQTETSAVRSIDDLLRANVGAEARLALHDQPAVTGTIMRVLQAENGQARPMPRHRAQRILPPTQPMVMLRTPSGVVSLRTHAIQQVHITGDPATSVQRTEAQPTLRLELDRPAPGRTVGIDYLARGITWAPSYRVDLSEQRRANLAAKAVIMNEATDLRNVEVELISGFPHLRFADVQSPVALNQSIAQFLQALSAGEDGQGAPQVTRQMVMSNRAEADMSMPTPQYGRPAEGQQAEDLFFYPIDRLTLAEGETAMVPLFSAECEYHHLYTWSIADRVDEHNRYRGGANAQDNEEQVWHTVRLTNQTGQPLTTAPMQFVKDGRIVGQGMCHFTNSGDQATVKVNRTMRIVAESEEVEIERERDAERFHRTRYDRVMVEGTLRLHSHFDKPVKLEITKMLSGEIVSVGGDPKVTAVAEGLRRVNPRQRVVWTFDLKPGEKELTYRYEIYVRG